MNASDVIVIGGGVIGCSVAYSLAREGLSVTLLERDELPARTSGAAAGMLAPICESTGSGPFFEFGVQSLGMFPALAGELLEVSGIDPQYVPSGVLRVAGSPEEARHLRARVALLSGYGLEWLTREAALEREPQLTPEIEGALWSPREGHVYSPRLSYAYAQAAARLGVRIERRTPVAGLVRQGSRVTGVRTERVIRAESGTEAVKAEWSAGHVVLCAGAWTRFCAEWLDVRLPVEPVRGQILTLEGPPPPLHSIIWGEDAYLVPKLDGRVLAGATQERVGFDCRNTAAGVAGLLVAALRLVPALADSTFHLARAGLRPDTPDHLPIIGPVPGVEGLTVAAGHFRNGILLSPVTGRVVADWIVRGSLSPDVASFQPERFLRES
jgi:glycine oxidase